MKKVTLVLVVLCLMVSGQIFAGSIAKLGLSLKSNLEATAATGGSTPGKSENGLGFYGAYDFYWQIPASPIQAGLGFELPKSFEDGLLTVKFMPLYGVINASFEGEKVKPYLSGKLGYSFFNGSENLIVFSVTNYTGGLFYSVGGGLIFDNNLRVEAAYSVSHGENTITEMISGNYDSIRVSYKLSNITLSLGYSF